MGILFIYCSGVISSLFMNAYVWTDWPDFYLLGLNDIPWPFFVTTMQIVATSVQLAYTSKAGTSKFSDKVYYVSDATKMMEVAHTTNIVGLIYYYAIGNSSYSMRTNIVMTIYMLLPTVCGLIDMGFSDIIFFYSDVVYPLSAMFCYIPFNYWGQNTYSSDLTGVVPVYDLTDWTGTNVYYTFMFTFLGAGAIHCFTAWIT